jgi:hypothetical protein
VRQAILVVVLVGASFLGGAFVNGPGLQWAKARVLRSFGLTDSSEIASIDLKATASSDTTSDGSSPASTEAGKMQGPVAPMPSVIGDKPTSGSDAFDQLMPSQPSPKSGKDAANSAFSSPSSLPPLRPATLAPALAKSSNQVSAATDLQVKPAKALSPSVPSRADPRDKPALFNSLAALLPSTPPASDSASPISLRSPSALKPVPDGGDEWALLERKMQTLGVSRFTVEAEPGGRVVFSCLIPLAGRQAVSQRFEAEGDDMVQAAHAALRRIGLWRAAQAPSH